MSVFKVKLNNTVQGRLDLDPSTNTSSTYGNAGNPFAVSNQRQIYVAGPNRKYRLLKDGEQFTDCNYWKRFTPEVIGLEHSFIEVVSDDGSVYSDVAEENTFSIGGTLTLATDYSTANTIDFVTTYDGPAKFVMIQNLDAEDIITGELNGDTNITFLVGAGETMMFNQGDMSITMLRLKASAAMSASYIASVRSVCNS